MKNIFKWPIFYIIVILIFILFSRLPFVWNPIYNVDEGVSATIGNSILEGGVVYKDAIDQRGPITYYIYALIFLLFRNIIFVDN